jgi:hypothetical protein
MKKKMSGKYHFLSIITSISNNRFIMETDHHTYITCHCGTSIVEQPFEEIWNILMPILNHFEEMLTSLAPSKFASSRRKIMFCFVKVIGLIGLFNVRIVKNFPLWVNGPHQKNCNV